MVSEHKDVQGGEKRPNCELNKTQKNSEYGITTSQDKHMEKYLRKMDKFK